MASLSILLITSLVLGPFLCVLFTVRFVVPKHTLKIREIMLLPIAFTWLILTTIIPIKLFLSLFSYRCWTVTCLIEWMPQNLVDHFWIFLAFGAFLYFIPSCIAYILLKTLIHFYYLDLRIELVRQRHPHLHKKIRWSGIKVKIAEIINNSVLNHLSRLTASVKGQQEPMMDIATTDGYLYSGMYKEHYLEDGEVSGVALRNCLRHTKIFKESEGKFFYENYIIPNNGEMFFPTSSISNYHVWKLNARREFIVSLQTENDAKKLVWLSSLQWAYRHLRIKIKVKRQDVNPDVAQRFFFEIDKLNLDARQISIEWLPSEDSDTSKSNSQVPPSV